MAQAHEYVCELERRADLLSVDLDGWSVWPLLRRGVAGQFTQGPRLPVTFGTRIRQLIPAFGDPLGILGRTRAQYVIKNYTTGLMDEVDGRYRDIYFDDVLDGLQGYCKIETINNPAFLARRRKAAIPSDFTTGAIDVATKTLSRIRRIPAIEQAAAELARRIRQAAGASIFPEWRIQNRCSDFYWHRFLYGKVFDRLGAQTVLTADIGDFGMVAAARERGIRVLELQHGIFPRCHSAYSWTDYATPYRSAMPLPNDLLVYGEYWCDELSSGGFWGEGLRAVGSPRMDRYRAKKRTSTGDLPIILWTSQGVDVPNAIAFIRDFLRAASSASPFRLVIKLHPVYDEQFEETYRAAFGGVANVELIRGGDQPSVFDLLLNSDLHVSISSTCHYDAIGLGVPTCVIPLANHEIVLPLVNSGYARLTDTPGVLASVVHEIGIGVTVDDSVRERLYRSNAVEHIRHVIDMEG